ncbi:hypothetical protein TICRE_17540 [Tissierella creatinophila DSM 6911]|uniref:Uncharacterized protein n=1 Tax=Tissierella creatinophila DSM 6911 TaxID=1123403 RepID=A0A1U7M4Y0_TISCR|nr:hypothetical protein TICRE_17540 [Tissierella creatinophila DSM 6911]
MAEKQGLFGGGGCGIDSELLFFFLLLVVLFMPYGGCKY